MGDTTLEKHDLDASRGQFEVLGVVPSNTRDGSNSNNQDSKSKISSIPSKLKEKVSKLTPGHHHSKGSDTKDSEPSIEESGLMHIKSNTGSHHSSASTTNPNLARHISSIPQTDDGPSQPGASNIISPSLEKTISNLPPDDYDSETESPIPHKGDPPVEKHDSGTAGSDFEVGDLMHLKSDDSGKKSPDLKKPELERHISAIPQRDDDGNEGKERPKMSRLERTISKVPQDDFDSEGEDAV